VGEFDLVVMGYVLQMLRDPLGALEAVRRVCRGRMILLETISRLLDLLPALPWLDLTRAATAASGSSSTAADCGRPWNSPAGLSRRSRRCSKTDRDRELLLKS